MNKNNKRIILLSFLILSIVSGLNISFKLGSVAKVSVSLPSTPVVVMKVNAVQNAVNNYKAITSTSEQRQAWFEELNKILAQKQLSCNCQNKLYQNMNFYWNKYNEQKLKLEKMKIDKNFAQKYKQLAIKYLKEAQTQEKLSNNMFINSQKEFDVNTKDLTVAQQLYLKKQKYLDEVWKYEVKIRKLKAMILNFQKHQEGVRKLAHKFSVEYNKVIKTINLHNEYKMKYWNSSIEFMKKSRTNIVDFNKYLNLFKEYKARYNCGTADKWNLNVNINQFKVPTLNFNLQQQKKEVLDLTVKLPKRETDDLKIVSPYNLNLYKPLFDSYYFKMEVFYKKTQDIKAYYNQNVYRFKNTLDQNIKVKSFIKANENVEDYVKMQNNARSFSKNQYDYFSKLLLEVKDKLANLNTQQKVFISQKKQREANALNQQKKIYDEAVLIIGEILTKIYLYLNTKQDVLAAITLEGPEFNAIFYERLLARLKKKRDHIIRFRNAYMQYVADYSNQGFQTYAKFYANKVQRYNVKLQRLERLIGIYEQVFLVQRNRK